MAFSEESNDVVALLDEEDTQALQHLETRISDWLHRVTKGGRGLPPGQDAAFEVEAKFGTLIDRDTNERLRTHPANCESYPVPNSRPTFLLMLPLRGISRFQGAIHSIPGRGVRRPIPALQSLPY